MRPAKLVGDELLPSAANVPGPWPPRRVQVDGEMLHVRDTAAVSAGAEPAVYVHGLGGSSQNYTDLAWLLAGRLDGEAIDLPGFGYSDPTRRYSLKALADRLISYLEQAGRGAVHLVGNSLGGSMAVRVAGLRPDLVRSLTLISPAMPFLDPRRTAHGRVLPVLALPGADRIFSRVMARMTPEEIAEQVLVACFGDPTKVSAQRRAEAMEEVKLRFTVEHYSRAYLGTLRGLVSSFLRAYLPGAESLWRIAGRIVAPTLVIGGTTDKVIDTRVPAQVAKAIPDSRLLILQGVGHVAQMEEPRMVARAISALLNEISAVPARS